MLKKLCFFAALLLAVSCNDSARTTIPEAPDYHADSIWFHLDRQAAADLFYIASTQTLDYIGQNGIQLHHADAAHPTLCPGITSEMRGVDRRLSGQLNFYSPYYRQITMESYLDPALVSQRAPVAVEDCRRAFEEYLARMNGGRPFVLAGFSQGGQMALELLKSMPEEASDRLVAVYLIGWKVTEEDLRKYPVIRPATGADDTGVTICYNSVHTPEDAFGVVSQGNAVAINPVNWRTDATPAALTVSTNPDGVTDNLTVTLDPASKFLLVDGYTSTSHAFPPYWRGGNYHTFEIRWYSDCLKENIALRTRAFLDHSL